MDAFKYSLLAMLFVSLLMIALLLWPFKFKETTAFFIEFFALVSLVITIILAFS